MQLSGVEHAMGGELDQVLVLLCSKAWPWLVGGYTGEEHGLWSSCYGPVPTHSSRIFIFLFLSFSICRVGMRIAPPSGAAVKVKYLTVYLALKTRPHTWLVPPH